MKSIEKSEKYKIWTSSNPVARISSQLVEDGGGCWHHSHNRTGFPRTTRDDLGVARLVITKWEGAHHEVLTWCCDLQKDHGTWFLNAFDVFLGVSFPHQPFIPPKFNPEHVPNIPWMLILCDFWGCLQIPGVQQTFWDGSAAGPSRPVGRKGTRQDSTNQRRCCNLRAADRQICRIST